MNFRQVLALRGPNIWAHFPVLEVLVDLGELKNFSSREIPGFSDRILAWVPSMDSHQCNNGPLGTFRQQLQVGTEAAHALEHLTIELQSLVDSNVSFGRTYETDEPGVYRVIVRYEEESLGRAALEAARQLCIAAALDRPFDIHATMRKLREISDRDCLGPSTRAIVQAARARRIPVRKLNFGSLVQLGHGARRRYVRTAETDVTGAVAEAVAQDKELTKKMLRMVGVPVPEGRPATSDEDAWAAAQEVGLPVVVKPQEGNHGRGVYTNLSDREQVLAAFHLANGEGDGVMVERFAPGAEHRLLVVNGQVVAATRGDPAKIVGDGQKTVADLIEEQVNSDPRRGDADDCPLDKIRLDSITRLILEEQGYNPESIPAAGKTVVIRRHGNHAIDVTDQVHPEVAARAVAAARVVGLDIAGIDMVIEDVGKPLEVQGGAVIEVNARPGLQMHVAPSMGTPRPVGEAIVAHLFPGEATGRVPVVAITGPDSRVDVARLVATIFERAGQRVGLAAHDGLFVGGRLVQRGDCSGARGAEDVLANTTVQAAVLETSPTTIRRDGLGFESCDVAVVTGLAEDILPQVVDIAGQEKLAVVERTLVEAVAVDGCVVLRADHPGVVAMAPHCSGSVIYFAVGESHAVLAQHREQSGRVVFLRGQEIVLSRAGQESIAATLVDTSNNANVETLLAAAAAGWAANIEAEVIRETLESFGQPQGGSFRRAESMSA
jgi:cyanophycin synthetase